MSTPDYDSENDYSSSSETSEDDMFDGDDGDYDPYDFALMRSKELGRSGLDLLEIPLADTPVDYDIDLAVGSNLRDSRNLYLSASFISDSLSTYLKAPPLLRRNQRTGQHSLFMDPTSDMSAKKSLSTSELYVGNVPRGIRWGELKDYFIKKGFGVSRVSLKNNKVRVNSLFY